MRQARGGIRLRSCSRSRPSATTSLSPEQVIRAAADFSERREKLWPSKNKYLRVHDQGTGFAEVTEAFRMVGVFWERSRYDWSQPGTIRQTVIDSNVLGPASTWELTTTPSGEGSEVVMRLSREFRSSLQGRIGWTVNHLAGARLWGSYLRRALAEAEKQPS